EMKTMMMAAVSMAVFPAVALAGPLYDECSQDGGTEAQCSCFEETAQEYLDPADIDIAARLMRQDMSVMNDLAARPDSGQSFLRDFDAFAQVVEGRCR
ncbi:MAG: hypothetical protein ACPGID_09800, partial [Rubricella sp.]